MKRMVEKGKGIVKNEKFRLWCDEPPLYHMLDWHQYLLQQGP
jgi:hypothetical protein